MKTKPSFIPIFFRKIKDIQKGAFVTPAEAVNAYQTIYNNNIKTASPKVEQNKQNVAFAKEQYSNIKNSFQLKKKS